MEYLRGSISEGKEENHRLIRTNNNGELCVVPPTSGVPYRYFLTASGDGAGATNLNGNYAATPTDFYYLATNVFDIYTLAIAVSDNAKFNQVDYGAIAGGITNGVSFFMEIAPGVEIRLVSVNPVRHNYDWLSDMSDTQLTTFEGLSQTLVLTLHLEATFGMPLIIQPGWKVIVRLNDDFTSLINHTFAIRGILQTTSLTL